MNPVVTIRAENLKAGDTLILEGNGEKREVPVLRVFVKDWPDRVNVGLIYREGSREVEWEFRPFNLIKVRKSS